MAKNGSNIWFILGGLLSLVGVLLFFIDNTFAMWQIEIPSIFTTNRYYLNAFGSLFFDGEEYQNWQEDGGTYLYAGILIVAAAIIVFIAGIKNYKVLGILASLAILGGCAYFIYSHVQFFTETSNNIFTLLAGLAGLEPSETIWGSNNDIVWRLGNGFFMVAGGGLLSLIGMKK